MSYIALYRKFRPQTFEDVVEQNHVVKTLKNSILYGKVAHAYLFCGTRGTGKTSIARIFARAVNCKNSSDGNPCNSCAACSGALKGEVLDIVEIDAASNTGVDNVREIREDTAYSPTQLKYKVYIIDEVHMLSTGAFNALLKVLEEPPAHVIFLLATTEPHKIPATIVSRCQRFDFKRISTKGLCERLLKIAKESNMQVAEDALKLISDLSDGAMRDAISILEQCVCIHDKQITYSDVINIVGMPSNELIFDIVHAIYCKDAAKVLQLIEKFADQGKEISQLIVGMISYYRILLVYGISKQSDYLIGFSDDFIPKFKEQANMVHDASDIIRQLCTVEQSLKWSNYQRILVEVGLVKLCEAGNAQILAKVQQLEEKINAVFKMLENQKHVNIAEKEDTSTRILREQKKIIKNKVTENKDKSRIAKLQPIEKWQCILEQLKKDGKMALYISLVDSKLVKVSETLMNLVFNSKQKFNYSLACRPENLDAIESAVKSILGGSFNVRCVLLDENQDGIIEKQAVQVDNLLKKVQDVAAAFDVPVNIIDN